MTHFPEYYVRQVGFEYRLVNPLPPVIKQSYELILVKQKDCRTYKDQRIPLGGADARLTSSLGGSKS